MPGQIGLLLNLPVSINSKRGVGTYLVFIPESVRTPLLQHWLLTPMEEVPRADHVEEVELGVDRDGGLHPGIVSSCAFCYH